MKRLLKDSEKTGAHLILPQEARAPYTAPGGQAMSNPIVRCRCGHQVLEREVLRTQSCEKASGAEVIYIKYRCRRCKKIGEAFIPHEEFCPEIFAAPRNEMAVEERDRFLDEGAINSGDVISFHRALQKVGTLSDLLRPEPRRKAEKKSEKRGKDSPQNGDKPPRHSRENS